MKNIHVLPTDKPSRLIIYSTLLNEFRLLDEPIEDWKHKRNIYITSDEEIKKGDYYIHGNRLHKHLGKKCLDVLTSKEYQQSSFINKDSVFKKIILTDNKDLIKDGVQAIDDDFLEWFVKNPNCDSVEFTEYLDSGFSYGYKIIIPKEEPKQETLEEVAKKKYPMFKGETYIGNNKKMLKRAAFIAGAKWQQEQNKKLYSELVDLLERLTTIYKEDSDLHHKYDKQRLNLIKLFKNK